MGDTLNNLTTFDLEAEKRNMMLEEGLLIEASSIAKKVGFKCKVAVTRNFFYHIYPFAEDATKNVTWEDLMGDVFTIFKKEFSRTTYTKAEFALNAKTHVKKVTFPKLVKKGEEYSPLVECFADGKARDKRLIIEAIWMPDEKKKPSLVFSVKEFKWLK